MNKLHDALEDCLLSLQEGKSLEATLGSHPEEAAELRPLVQAALRARTAGQGVASADVTRRGRARLLERARELGNQRRAPAARVIAGWPRLAITLGLVAILMLTSTGLVSASSGALPGDQLYQVKRTWEDMQLFFVHPEAERDLLESRLEQERLDEIGELLGQRRAAPITFSGLVMQQQDGHWLVSGIHVSISDSTLLPARPISGGEPVIITGTTRSDSTVEAQRVQLLKPGSSLPPLQPSGTETEARLNGLSPTTLGDQSPVMPRAQATYEFTGIIESLQPGAWRINSQSVYADQATVIGVVKVGSAVKFEGYYSADGRFVVTKLTVEVTPAQSRTNPREGSLKGSGDSDGESPDNGAGGGD